MHDDQTRWEEVLQRIPFLTTNADARSLRGS